MPLTPIGLLDTTPSPKLQTAVDENISGATDLTIDFSKLIYLSFAGLRVLINTRKIMLTQGKMRIVNVNEDIMEIFDITGLTDVFRIE